MARPLSLRLRTELRVGLFALFPALLLSTPSLAGTISGTVKDSVTNAAISGVLVQVNGQPTKKATTSSSGTYSIKSVSAGAVTLNASKSGYVTQNTGSITVPASGTVTAPLILLVKKGTLSGRVVQPPWIVNISGVTVTASPGGTTATTSYNGTFSLSLEPGTYTLSLAKSGYVPNSAGPFSVTSGQTTSTGDLLLGLAAITGHVISGVDASPMAGATASITGTSDSTTTDAAGAFTLPTDLSSPQTVTVSKSGWVDLTSDVVYPDQGQTVDIGTLALQPALTISGQVIDSVTFAPVVGASVWLPAGDSALTDAAGRFTLSAAPGTWTLQVALAGYTSLQVPNVVLVSGVPLDVGVLQLVAFGTLTGHVVRQSDGSPLQGATIVVEGFPYNLTSDATGLFSAQLRAGPSSLTASYSGLVPASVSNLTISPHQTTDVGNVQLYAYGILTGVVTRSTTGAPVAGATVKLTGTTNSTTTDANGRFTLGNLPPPSVTLTISASLYGTITTGLLTVPPGQTGDVGSIPLPPYGTVTGVVRVNCQGDMPIPSVLVTSTSAVSPSSFNTGSDGAYSFSAPPGPVTFVFRRDDLLTQYATVTVLPEQTTVAPDVYVYFGTYVDGRVLDEASSPLAGVRFESLTFPTYSTQTGADGRFTITMPESVQDIQWTKVGYRPSRHYGAYVRGQFCGWYTVHLGDKTLHLPPGTDAYGMGGTVRLDAGLQPWVVGSYLSASDLSIDSGVTVRLGASARLETGLHVLAEGTAENPIVFTSDSTSPGPGSWTVTVSDNSRTSRLSNVRFEANSSPNEALQVGRGAPFFDHVLFVGMARAVVTSSGTSPTFRNSAFETTTSGIRCGGSTTPVDARLSYWNADSGPSGSGAGTGVTVDPCVLYDPWLRSAPSLPQYFSSAFPRNATFNPGVGVLAHIDLATSLAGDWTVQVRDSGGTLVRSFSGSGQTGTFAWDGRDTSGTLLPDGTYSYELSSVTPSGDQAAHPYGRLQKSSSLTLTLGALAISNPVFSPNGDGARDTTTFSAAVNLPDATWTVELRDGIGTLVRTATGSGNVGFVWDGRDNGGSVVPDGPYGVAVSVVDDSATASVAGSVTVDTAGPSALLSVPSNGGIVSNLYQAGATTVVVTGTVQDPALTSWALDYGLGSTPTAWTRLASGSSPVSGATLATWDTTSLANGPAQLRLTGTDGASNTTVTLAPVQIANFSVTESARELKPESGMPLVLTSVVPLQVQESVVLKNPAGEVVRTLVSGLRAPATYPDSWDGTSDSASRLPDGLYQWFATFTDGSSTLTIDLSSQLWTDWNFASIFDYHDFDPYNNKPLVVTGSFTDPGDIGFVFTQSTHILGASCDPPNFCRYYGDFSGSGPFHYEWAGIDDTGAMRPDIHAVWVFSVRDYMPKNGVVLSGARPSVRTVQVSPPVLGALDAIQTVSFVLATYQDQPADATVTFINQTTHSPLRTIQVPNVSPGTVEIPWDGRADNGMPVAAGTYAVIVRVIDRLGQHAEGEILSTVEH